MRIHFPSVAVGIAAVSVIFVSMSQSTPTVSAPRVEYGPHPRDMVQIREGTPYVVPAGRLFVLTGLGANEAVGSSPAVQLRVNGQQELAAGLVDGSASAGLSSVSSVASIPVGFTVAAGNTLDVSDSNPNVMRGRAWGYLANL